MSSRRLLTFAFRFLRLAFRCVPMSVATRDRLRARFLERYSRFVPPPPRGANLGGRREMRARIRAGAQAIGHRSSIRPVSGTPSARVIAFYLPQFHPIPENDAWWGSGFTEWHNVSRALPQFEGHQQPRLPADLGFYDLRNPGVMRAQADLARAAGIEGFCSYFYWFAGTTLLEAPLENWLSDPSIDLPLCLCWANETWSRRWDGRADDVLIQQSHSADDDLAFIAHVSAYLRDPRYIRVDGKPMLLVYRPHLLPDAAATAQRWRTWCRDHGVGELHLVYVQGFERPDPRDIGFDAAVEFPPNMSTPPSIAAQQALINPSYAGEVLDWRALARNMALEPLPDYRLYPGVNPGWDNEPRRSGAGRVYLHASPRGYRDWLRTTIHTRMQSVPQAHRIVFVNAWNEWAEGAVLEPDQRLGHAWLHATRQALSPAPVPSLRPCAVIHVWYIDIFTEILSALRASGLDWRIVVTTAPQHQAAVRACVDAAGMTADVHVFENRGRDILPFLRVAGLLLDDGVDIVLKLHTKRSVHLPDGDAWRRSVMSNLLDPHAAPVILSALQGDPVLGAIAPDGHLCAVAGHIGANGDALAYLRTILGLPASDSGPKFVAGSMLWLRLPAIAPLLDAGLPIEGFDAEAGQIDGTLAHAVERLIGEAIEAGGYRLAERSELDGLLADPAIRLPYQETRS